MTAEAALFRDLAALAECMRLVAGGIDRLVAKHGPALVAEPASPPVAGATAFLAGSAGDTRGSAIGPRWTVERIGLITSLVKATPQDVPVDWRGIAETLSALPGVFVSAIHARDWWSKVGMARAGMKPHPVVRVGASAGLVRAETVASPLPAAPPAAAALEGASPARKRSPYPQDLVDDVLRRNAAGERQADIARALGVDRQKVNNIVTWRGPKAEEYRKGIGRRTAETPRTIAAPASPLAPAQPAMPAPRPPAPARPVPQGVRRVEIPGAADDLRHQMAESLVAPADELTIRSWAAANGVDIPGGGELGAASLLRVNAVREREQLPPFKLVRKPLGVVSAAELERMRNDAAVPEQPGVHAVGHSGGSYGAPAPR